MSKMNRRIIYKYTCDGCHKQRNSYKFQTAKGKVCPTCKKSEKVQNELLNQTSIFDLAGES